MRVGAWHLEQWGSRSRRWQGQGGGESGGRREREGHGERESSADAAPVTAHTALLSFYMNNIRSLTTASSESIHHHKKRGRGKKSGMVVV